MKTKIYISENIGSGECLRISIGIDGNFSIGSALLLPLLIGNVVGKNNRTHALLSSSRLQKKS